MMNVNEIHGRQVLTQETIDDRNIIPAHLYCGSQSERNPDTFRPHTVQFYVSPSHRCHQRCHLCYWNVEVRKMKLVIESKYIPFKNAMPIRIMWPTAMHS